MKQLIHKRFKVTIAFEKKEAEAFYDALLHYNNDTILDAGYSMFNRDETPLQNHWDDDVAFLTCYYLFRKMAKKMSKSHFVKTIVTLQQPSKILFEWLLSNETYKCKYEMMNSCVDCVAL